MNNVKIPVAYQPIDTQQVMPLNRYTTEYIYEDTNERASFTDLIPNETYNFYIMEDRESTEQKYDIATKSVRTHSKEITLTIALNEKTVWTINGTDVNVGEVNATDIFVGKTAKEDGNLSIDALESLSSTREIEQLVFAHNDMFGFMGRLTLDMDDISGNKAVLLQTANNSLERVDTALITDNTITFEITKGADSAIVYGYNGDINGDEEITIKDMMLMLHTISGRTTLNEIESGFADVDMNDKINLQDLMREMHYVSGRETEVYSVE